MTVLDWEDVWQIYGKIGGEGECVGVGKMVMEICEVVLDLVGVIGNNYYSYLSLINGNLFM